MAAPGWILGIYTDKVEIIALAKPYMRIVGWSYPLQVFAAIITALLKSTERVKVRWCARSSHFYSISVSILC